MSDIARRTVKNSLYSLIAYGWPILLSFFATPFIVHHLGAEFYGILALVTSSVGFLAFTDFGITPSLVKYTVDYHVQKDYLSFNKLYSTAQVFYGLIGLVGAAGIAWFGHSWAPRLFHVSAANVHILQLVFYVSAVGFLLQMIMQAYVVIPNALQRLDLTSKVNLFVTTVSTGLSVILLLMGHGVVALAVVGVALTATAILMYVVLDKRLVPQLKLFYLHADLPFAKKIFAFGGYATVATMATTILFELDKIILGSKLGPTAVTFYVLPGNLTIKIYAALLAIMNIVFPLSAELIAKNDQKKLHALYRRATRVLLTTLVFFVTPMYIFAGKFLLYWLGPDFAHHSTLVMQLLLATYSLISLTIIPFAITYSSGKPKYAAFFSVLSGGLNVLLMFILIPRYQINGAAIAYILAVVPNVLYLWFVERRLLHFNSARYYVRTLPKLIVTAAFLLIIAWFLRRTIHSLSGFLVSYLLTLALGGTLFLLLRLFDPDDWLFVRDMWRQERNS